MTDSTFPVKEEEKVGGEAHTKADSEQEQTILFSNEYEALCKKYGRMISVQPRFRLRDDGTYSIVVDTQVRRIVNGR